MSSPSDQSGRIPVNVYTGDKMCEGRKSLPVNIDFSQGANFFLDLSSIQGQGPQKYISSVQTLYIDNVDNTAAIDVVMDVSKQRIRIPAGSEAYIPVLEPNPPKITFTCANPVIVPVQVLNFFVPPYIWGNNFAFTPAGYLEVSDPALDAIISNGALATRPTTLGYTSITNDSSTITAGGTAQQAIAANANRKRFIVSNPDSASETLYLILGASGNGQIPLLPGMTWDESGSSIFQGAVYVLAATTGHAFTAYEA